MDELPSEFDLIVVGTGFNESVIAAAASRVGKSVFHIDENDFYGGFWSSFNFDTFLSHLERCKNDEKFKSRLRNVEESWFEFSEEHAEVNGWNKDKVMKESRRFNIDLIPKVRK
jgi:Rab proteins geranylgeranyltransferase component A